MRISRPAAVFRAGERSFGVLSVVWSRAGMEPVLLVDRIDRGGFADIFVAE